MASALSWQRVLLLVAAVGFAFAAVVMRLSFFAFALYALGAVSLVAYVMTWSALDRLETERHTSARDAEIGEDLVVTVAVRNTKPLPVLWLVAEDIVPRGLEAAGSWARAVLLMPFASTRLQCACLRPARAASASAVLFGDRRFLRPQSPLRHRRERPLRHRLPACGAAGALRHPLAADGETVVKRRLVEDLRGWRGMRETPATAAAHHLKVGAHREAALAGVRSARADRR